MAQAKKSVANDALLPVRKNPARRRSASFPLVGCDTTFHENIHRRDYIIPTVFRATVILKIVTQSNFGVTVTELYDQTRFARSTIYRILRTLSFANLLRQDAQGRYWSAAALESIEASQSSGSTDASAATVPPHASNADGAAARRPPASSPALHRAADDMLARRS